jgi:sigma-B regulation protein RsbU (phosphoserine phosphatase)
VVVLYTDGVTEATNAELEEFGTWRLKTTITQIVETIPEATAHNIVEAIKRAVNEFTGNVAQQDDMTLFVIKHTRDVMGAEEA